MRYTILGKTGLRVSRLGFGCMRLPMTGEQVDRELAIPMLQRAVELGVNYFDTAVGYCHGDSQRVLGEAMEGIRDRVVISTKNPHYDKKDERGWWKNLEDSLKRLRTDYIDIYNFHGLNWRAFTDHVAGADGQIQWMLRAKEQGLIRHICHSFHDNAENLKKLASTGLFECVTLQYNLLDRSNEPAFGHVASKCGMGIVVMGPVGGGRLGEASDEIRRITPGARTVPEVALRFVLANPYVSVALSGMSTIGQLEENAVVASRKTPLSAGEKRRVAGVLRRFRKLADLYCTGCNYCMPCPRGVNIPGNFTALNYDRVYGLKQEAKRQYAHLASGRASYCVACGRCMSKCPQKIDIIGQLRDTVRTLDDTYGHLVVRAMPTKVGAFRKSKGTWRATIAARFDLQSLSDEPVEAEATLGAPGGAAVKPDRVHGRLDAFGRKSTWLEITCCSDGAADLVDLQPAVTGSERVDLVGTRFRVAFARGVVKSIKRTLSAAVPIVVGSPDQLARGARRVLATHGAVCRFAYDDKALHLAADVRDDLHGLRTPGLRPRDSDRLMLLIDARPEILMGRPTPPPWVQPNVVEIHFLPPALTNGAPVRIARPHGRDGRSIACRGAVTHDGYRVEAAIPWVLLKAKGKKRPRHLGLDLALISHNKQGKRNVEMLWSGAASVGQADRFGHLFLTG